LQDNCVIDSVPVRQYSNAWHSPNGYSQKYFRLVVKTSKGRFYSDCWAEKRRLLLMQL